MCGFGVLLTRNKISIDKCEKSFRKNLAHRGPDGASSIKFASNRNIEALMCHARLSIIGPNKNGSQPMKDPLTGVTIVFNGEIYNYLTLREQLIGAGHKFVTKTDTEVQ